MRRLYHLIGGLFLVLIVAHVDKNKGLILVSSLLLIAIITETARLLLPNVNRLFLHYLGLLLRENEKRQPTGTGYYLGGIFFSLLLFEREIALFSMTILAVGDPAASTIGKRWGLYPIGGKSVGGGMAFFITTVGAGLLFHGLWPTLPLWVLITGSIAGTLAEIISNKVNDNLTIPLAASGAMEALSFFLNFIQLH